LIHAAHSPAVGGQYPFRASLLPGVPAGRARWTCPPDHNPAAAVGGQHPARVDFDPRGA